MWQEWESFPIPDLRGKAFIFSLLSIVLAVGLSYVAFITLRCVPSMALLLRVFIINNVEICHKFFSTSIEMIIWFLFSKLLVWCIILICNYSWGNGTWSWSLMYCWILFANIFLRIFASAFISDIGLKFSFLWYLCLVLDQGDAGLVEWVGKCPFCRFLK